MSAPYRVSRSYELKSPRCSVTFASTSSAGSGANSIAFRRSMQSVAFATHSS